MLVVQLLGGLGNQMFQYAFGKALAKKYGHELLLDRSVLEDRTPRPYAVFRDYDLDKLQLDIPSAPPKLQLAQRYRSAHFLKKIFYRRWKNIDEFKIIREVSFSFSEHYSVSLPNKSYLIGYWQSPHYFQEIESEIRTSFSIPPKSTSPKFLQYQDDIISNQSSVCIHVRRGDYVTNKRANLTHGFLGETYIDRALQLLQSKSPLIKIFIFSDDIQWCQQNLKFHRPTVFVDLSNEKDNLVLDLALMRQCTHFIISNSSYGWWAAWLGASPLKQVIAPKVWFINQKMNEQSQSLIPESWLRI